VVRRKRRSVASLREVEVVTRSDATAPLSAVFLYALKLRRVRYRQTLTEES
jgi:hypothetical protein